MSKSLSEIIDNIKYLNYVDYEYLNYNFWKNYKTFNFLGNKRNYNVDNQYLSRNENILVNSKSINSNLFQKTKKNELINNYKYKKIYGKEKIFVIEKVNKKIMRNTIDNNFLTSHEFNEKDNVNLINKELFNNIKKVIKYKRNVYINTFDIKKVDKKKRKSRKY